MNSNDELTRTRQRLRKEARRFYRLHPSPALWARLKWLFFIGVCGFMVWQMHRALPKGPPIQAATGRAVLR